MKSIFKGGIHYLYDENDIKVSDAPVKIEGEIKFTAVNKNLIAKQMLANSLSEFKPLAERINVELNQQWNKAIKVDFNELLEETLECELAKRGYVFKNKPDFYEFIKNKLIAISSAQKPAAKEVFLKNNDYNESILIYFDDLEIDYKDYRNLKANLTRRIIIRPLDYKPEPSPPLCGENFLK